MWVWGIVLLDLLVSHSHLTKTNHWYERGALNRPWDDTFCIHFATKWQHFGTQNRIFQMTRATKNRITKTTLGPWELCPVEIRWKEIGSLSEFSWVLHLHPRKLTWLAGTSTTLEMYFLLNIGIFPCHVSFQGCTRCLVDTMKFDQPLEKQKTWRPKMKHCFFNRLWACFFHGLKGDCSSLLGLLDVDIYF